MTAKLKTTLIAGLVALGGAFTMSAPAQAGNLDITLSFGQPTFKSVHHRPFYKKRYRPDRFHRYQRCHVGKALRKARKRGIRRAHVWRVGRRGVVVGGYKWGEFVRIGFANHRRCPVRFVKYF